MSRFIIVVALCAAAAGCSGDVIEIGFELGYADDTCGEPPENMPFDNDGTVAMHVYDIEAQEFIAERCFHFPAEDGRNVFGLPDVLNVPEGRIGGLPAGAHIVVELKIYNRVDGTNLCEPFDWQNSFNRPDLVAFSPDVWLEGDGEGVLIPMLLECP